MNNNTFDVSSLVFKTGNQKKFTKMKPFHTKINLMNITGEIFISIIELINFLNQILKNAIKLMLFVVSVHIYVLFKFFCTYHRIMQIFIFQQFVIILIL